MAAVNLPTLANVLLGVSAASAFLIPSRYTQPLKPHLASLFYPVAKPAAAAAERIHDRFTPPAAHDARPDPTIRAENDILRVRVAELTQQLETLKELNVDRANMGQARLLCTAVAIAGGDETSSRETLALPTASPGGITLKPGMAVIYGSGGNGGGIAGRVTEVGLAGSQVRLITDREFTCAGVFRRLSDKVENIDTPVAICEGAGHNNLVVRNLHMADVQTRLQPGDWLVLSDENWPAPLDGYRIGRVSTIEPLPSNPLFAIVHITPPADLMQLRELMVMNRTTPIGEQHVWPPAAPTPKPPVAKPTASASDGVG